MPQLAVQNAPIPRCAIRPTRCAATTYQLGTLPATWSGRRPASVGPDASRSASGSPTCEARMARMAKVAPAPVAPESPAPDVNATVAALQAQLERITQLVAAQSVPVTKAPPRDAKGSRPVERDPNANVHPRNAAITFDGRKLHITVDMSKPPQPSAKGKMLMYGTTGGFLDLHDFNMPGVWVTLAVGTRNTR